MEQSYLNIFKNTIQYIPSKVIVMVYTLVLVPLFANILSTKEMSIYFIAIQILNVICTISSDWITKSILRYHEKYSIENKIEDFYSNILWLTSTAFAIVIFVYFVLKNVIQTHMGIDTITFILTICLVIPCGLRQLLYQYLRVINKPLLYTLSIIMYQTIFIGTFIILAKKIPDASSALLAMNLAMITIDIFVIKQAKFRFTFKRNPNFMMLKETIKYASPLILTNVCYWFIINFSKLYFQNASLFRYTAIIGIFYLFAYNLIQPIGSVFLFAGFPELVSKYEHKKPIKTYWTNIIQLYSFCILPLVITFCYYYKDITKLIFPAEFIGGAILLPMFAIATFAHELLKITNSKYHIKNYTYIEMIIAVCMVVLAIIINYILIKNYAYIGAVAAILIMELLLLLVHSFIKFGNLEYLDYPKIFKSLACILIIGFATYGVINALFSIVTVPYNAIKIVTLNKIFLYVVTFYLVCLGYKGQILR